MIPSGQQVVRFLLSGRWFFYCPLSGVFQVIKLLMPLDSVIISVELAVTSSHNCDTPYWSPYKLHAFDVFNAFSKGS